MFLFLMVIVSSSWLDSASGECTGGDRSSVLVIPSSGPTICLLVDEYIQLRQEAKASAVTDVETTGALPPTDAALTPTSVSSTQSVPLSNPSSTEPLFYRYMSPRWLQTHANFTETPYSVSAQAITFRGPGLVLQGVLFKVDLIEAGVLHDNKTYIIEFDIFQTYPSSADTDPIFQICDGNYCAGLWILDQNDVRAFGGSDSVSHCVRGEEGGDVSAPRASRNWHVILELHPDSTFGFAYVSTTSLTYEYNEKLTPSRGLHFKMCRHDTDERYEFNFFKLTVRLNE